MITTVDASTNSSSTWVVENPMIHLRLRSFSKATTDLDDAEELVVNRILVLSGLITRSLKLVNVLFSMGRSSMTSAILAILAAVVSLLVLRPDLWRFSVAGGIGLASFFLGGGQ